MKKAITGRIGAGKTKKLFEAITEGSRNKRVILVSCFYDLRNGFMTAKEIDGLSIDEFSTPRHFFIDAINGDRNLFIKCSEMNGCSGILDILKEHKDSLNKDVLLVFDDLGLTVANKLDHEEKIEDCNKAIDFLNSLDCDVLVSFTTNKKGPGILETNLDEVNFKNI